jgi:hypothetical protein
MTTCSVSPERHSTTLYSSDDAFDWTFEGIVLAHQNKDMLIFEGLISGKFWAQTRPLGDLYFAYPPAANGARGPRSSLPPRPTAATGSRISSPASVPTPGPSRRREWAAALRRS